MNVKDYNRIIVPKIYAAKGFLGAFHNALDKSGPEAEKQMRGIGWNEEMRDFLLEVLNAFEKAEKSKLTRKQPTMQYVDAVKLLVLAANNGILRRARGMILFCRETDEQSSLCRKEPNFRPISEVASDLMEDQEGQRWLIEKLKEKGIVFWEELL